MTAYAIVNVKIKDPERYPEYASRVPQTLEKYGGRYLVRGGEAEVLEGSWDVDRLVVLEFESRERFHEWYNSPEYTPLRRLRQEIADTQLVLVDGYEPQARV